MAIDARSFSLPRTSVVAITALVIFLLLGYPVAFALAANGIFFGLIGIQLGLLQPSLFQALPERLWKYRRWARAFMGEVIRNAFMRTFDGAVSMRLRNMSLAR